MSPGPNGSASGLAQVADAIRAGERFLLCTHEHPDGDALGSLAAVQLGLAELGKDAVSYVAAQEFPLPREYRWLKLERLVNEPPSDMAERTIVFLDCGNIDRNPADVLKRSDAHIINVDHHHDNTLFGTVNWVDPACSSTAEMVWLLLDALGVALDLRIAEALYVGLVTDTGKFMYENTGPRAHRMAAELLSAGIDGQAIYRRLFEDVPQAKLELLARGLGRVERYEDGALTLTHLSVDDYASTGAEEAYSEGVVDHLRAVEGTAVAGLVRDLLAPGREGERKVSLRAADDRVDVSAIARAQGGGGHRRAAGFTTQMGWDELVRFLRDEVTAQIR